MTDWRSDDEELLTLLAGAIAEADPVPDHVMQAARETFTWADMDAALAELVFDSSVTAAGVRGEGAARQLIFQAPAVEIDLMVTTDGRRELAGHLFPPRAVAVDLLEEAGGRRTTTSDELGRFSFTLPRQARIRLTLVAGGGRVTTDWIDVP